MNHMVKYASKQQRTSNTCKQVIKTIISKADVTDNAGSAFRSSIIRFIGHCDVGKGEAPLYFCFGASKRINLQICQRLFGPDC